MSSQSLGQIYKKQTAGGPVAVKKEFSVPLDSIYIEKDLNLKAKIYREVVDGLKAAYSRGEYVPKIVVQPDDTGTTFKVIDGHHRYTALTELVQEGHDYRRVTVEGFSGSQADQVKLMITSSQGRNLTPVERATGYARLINQYGWTRQEVADEFLVHLSSVAHHIAISELPSSIKELVIADRVAADYAVELYRKHGESGAVNIITGSGETKATRKNTNTWRPASGKKVCIILKDINVRSEGDHMVARFTTEEWSEIESILKTLID